MAIVREFTCANGARVIVRDDCYRDCTAEEITRRWAEVQRVVTEIAMRNATEKGGENG